MKITCVLGSPRGRGNSTAIVNKFCDTAKGEGVSFDIFSLNQLNYKGCQGCMSCKTKSDRCVVKDELEPVLNSIFEADILVAASPVYMGDVTGQFKSFLDRTYSFMAPDFMTNPDSSRLPPGKKALIVITQGAPEEMFKEVPEKLEMMLKRYGFSEVNVIRGCGLREIGEAEGDKRVMDMAVLAAEQMVGL